MKESYQFVDDLKHDWCAEYGWDPSGFHTYLEWLEAHPDKKAAWLRFWETKGKSLIGGKGK